MARIPIYEGRIRAQDRVEYVLREKFEDVFDAFIASAELDYLSDMPKSLPGTDAIKQSGPVDADIERILQTHRDEVFIYPDSSRDATTVHSQGATKVRRGTTFQLAISVFFFPGAHESITRNGRQLTREEVMQLRAEVYTAVLLQVMDRHACDGEQKYIHEAKYAADLADTYGLGDVMMGICGVKYTIQQIVSQDTRRFEI